MIDDNRDDVPTRDVTRIGDGQRAEKYETNNQTSDANLVRGTSSIFRIGERQKINDDKFGVKYEKKKYFDVCNNCGKQGHTFKQCKNPITSFGVIVFRINQLQQREYLMIRRKDTLGYIDFMRGKYSASNQKYIFNMIEQMTIQEKYKLKKYTFDELWHDLWIEEHSLLSTEDAKPYVRSTEDFGRENSSDQTPPGRHSNWEPAKDPNVDVMSPRQAELARTPLLQASLADRRTVALGTRPKGATLSDQMVEDLRSSDQMVEDLRSSDRRSDVGDDAVVGEAREARVVEVSGDLRSLCEGNKERIPSDQEVVDHASQRSSDQTRQETRRKDVGVFSETSEVEISTEGLDETVNPEETTIDTSTIYQTYKQEEMNSRDKFIYLTTKNIKDIPHQSNLLPYLQKMSCKNDHAHDASRNECGIRSRAENIHAYSEGLHKTPEEYDASDTSTTKFKRCKSPGEFWESREDKGAISILHYLIELSIQNSTNASRNGSDADNVVPENSGRYESSGQRALLATTESRQAELAEDSREFLRHSTVSVATRNPRSVGFLDDDFAKLGIGRTMKASPIQDLNEESLLHRIRDERSNIWTEPEWGFPKGRRNFQEKDYDCALREMTEETGYPLHLMKNMKNILPFDEIFLGSNYKSYKHRYYLMYMNYEDSHITDRYDRSEVSMMRWKTYEECLLSIRPYNLEKKRLIKNIEITLSNYFHTAAGLPKTYSHR